MANLGADEQGEAIPFVRLFSPTDLQEVGWKMGEIIEGNHSWDWINPTVWRVVGLESSNVIEWLKRYMLIAGAWKVSLTRDNKEQFRARFIADYGYSAEDLDEYFAAFFQLYDAGKIPSSIYQPWSYEPSTVAQDIGSGISSVLSTRLIILGVLGIAAYAYFSKGLARSL